VSGQSSLTNENRAFKLGDGTQACTKDMLSKSTTWLQPTGMALFRKSYTFNIIDTPGVGDSDPENDEANMKMLYGQLKKMHEGEERLSLVLLVVKFPQFLDENCEDNIRFYKKMLPALMSNNAVLVITAVEKNALWEKKHSVSGSRPEDTVKKITEWIARVVGNTAFDTVTIDSLFNPESEVEADKAQQTRDDIFKRCVASPAVSLADLQLPKTRTQRINDKNEHERLAGEKEGLLHGLSSAKDSLDEASDRVKNLQGEIGSLKSELASIESELKDKDNEQLVIIHPEKFADTWHWFSRARKSFDISTRTVIRSKQFSEDCEVKKYEVDTDKRIKGTVRKKSWWWGSMECEIFLYSYKRDVHAEKIKKLRKKKKEQEATVAGKNRELTIRLDEQRKYAADVRDFEQKIANIEPKMAALQSEYIKVKDLKMSPRRSMLSALQQNVLTTSVTIFKLCRCVAVVNT
jgi:predicted  nucleic acid-binding Zn-ribbon protein